MMDGLVRNNYKQSLYSLYSIFFSTLGAVPEIILRGVGRRHFFVLWGGVVDNVSEGWGGNLSWGSRRI